MKKGIIINTVCIATAIACIALTFWGNLKNDGVLTIDAYMGVIATLIGVCATIVVGFQIVSFMELRNSREQIRDLDNRQREIENLRKRMERDNEKLQEQIHIVQTGISNAYMLLILYNTSEQKDVLRAVSFCSSIICGAYADSPANSKALFIQYQELLILIKELKAENKLGKIKRFIIKLKDVEINPDYANYHEIMKAHYEILSILDQVSDDEPAAEQK